MSTDLFLDNSQFGYFSVSKADARNNQDTIMRPFAHGRSVYFAVADGVGGNGHGDIASRQIVKICKRILSKSKSISMKALLENIWNEYRQYIDNNYQYMNAASTFTVCQIEDGELVVGHIGDCRVYVLNGINIKKITVDHTLANNMSDMILDNRYVHYFENIITSSFSYKNKYHADIVKHRLDSKSVIIVCSDGVYKTVSDNDILSCFDRNMNTASATKKLENLLKARFPKDDFSAVCYQID